MKGDDVRARRIVELMGGLFPQAVLLDRSWEGPRVIPAGRAVGRALELGPWYWLEDPRP